MTKLAMVIGFSLLATSAQAAVELPPQCYTLPPYSIALRLVRVASDAEPGTQLLAAKFTENVTRMIGTGLRVPNQTDPTRRDFVLSFIDPPTADTYRLVVIFDPDTLALKWRFFSAFGFNGQGTLEKFNCAEEPPFPPGFNPNVLVRPGY